MADNMELARLLKSSLSDAHAPVRNDSDLHPYSCATCRRRKVRCDRRDPCSGCIRSNIECVFPERAQRAKRSRATAARLAEADSGSSRLKANHELLDRLQKLEDLVRKQYEDRTRTTQQSPESSETLQNEGPEPPQSKVESAGGGDRSRYVGGTFWSMISDELEALQLDTEEIYEYTSDESPAASHGDFTATSQMLPDPQLFVLLPGSTHLDLAKLGPLPSHIPLIWQTYKENIDPITKIVHIPTVERMLNQDPDKLPPAMRALTHAIYFASAASMDEDEVRAGFGVDKSSLLPRYRAVVEQALVRAKFLTEPDMTICQAFLLFLLYSRQHDASNISLALTPILVGFSQVLGLHRDGSHFPNLSPFEIEMRRRLFWTICVLDLRAAEDRGTDLLISEYTHDTHIPLSIDDDDIDCGSTQKPESRTGHTDSSLCSIRCEAARIVRRVFAAKMANAYARQTNTAPIIPPYDGRQAVYQLRDVVVTMYPLGSSGTLTYSLCASIAHLLIAKIMLTTHENFLFPGASYDKLPSETQNSLCAAATVILEAVHASKTDPAAKRWRSWLEITPHWHAIAYVLLRGSYQPWDAPTERAWTALNHAFGAEGVNLLRGNTGIWVPLKRLHARAAKRREMAIQQTQQVTSNRHDLSAVMASDASTTQPVWNTTTCPYQQASFVFDRQSYAWNDFLPEITAGGATATSVAFNDPVAATNTLGADAGFIDPAAVDLNWDDLDMAGIEFDWTALQSNMDTFGGSWTMGL